MKDQNEFNFSGTIEQFKRVETRTGTPMISFRVSCGKEKILCVAFKTIAEQAELSTGSRVEVKGSVQSTSWQDKDGQQRTGWQVVAQSIEIVNDSPTQERQAPRPRQQQDEQSPRQQPDQFSYQGGPF